MSQITWPRRLRKKKPYTAAELTGGNCLAAASAILRANHGQGQMILIVPPEDVPLLEPVYPPAGGVVTEWFDHRAVFIDGRYYDCMTGPAGMTEDQYRALFQHGDVLVFRKADDHDIDQ